MSSFKATYGAPNTLVSSHDELCDYGTMLLAMHGYERGNRYGVGAYAICNEYGVIAVEIGQEHEVLDNAVDNNKLDQMLMSSEDYAEYSENGWDDSYMLLGNASEPFWTEYLTVQPI